MRRVLLTTVVLAALCAQGAHAAGPAMPVGHAGRWLTDATGRVTVMHGINMVYKRPPYAPDAVGFGDDDAAFLASEGLDTVRVGVIYKAVEPQPGVYDDAYIDRIKNTVDTLGRHGIVSLVDFHQDLYNERFQGEGWPDWAVQDDGLPNQPQSGFPANYLTMPALQHAFDHFWANDPGPGGVGLQDRYAAAWAHVAQRFNGDNAVLGFDLLNEPWPGSTWQQCANPAGCPVFDATMTAFIKRTVAAIRTTDQSTLVFYEPNVLFNDGADTTLGPIGDPRAVMSFHDYCLAADQGGSGYGGCGTADDLVFKNANAHAAKTGDGLLVTEFGATDTADVLNNVMLRADGAMVGWQEWQYCGCQDPTTSGPGDKQAIVLDPSKPPTGANVKTKTLDVIVRPYPQQVAGTPESWSFDPATKAFAAKWSTKRADGTGSFGAGTKTELFIPTIQYPNGYVVAVQGGTVVSAPRAQTLVVASCPGTSEVSVAVTATGTPTQSCAAPAAKGKRVRLSVSVSPKVVRTLRTVRLRVTVRAKGRPVRGAKVRVGPKRAVTDRKGHATLHGRFSRAGKHAVTATARGYRAGRATLRAV